MPSNMDDINTNGATNNEVNQLYNNGRSSRSGRTDTQILESIEQQLSRLIQSGGNINNMSASNARNQYGGRRGSTFYQDLSNGRIRNIGRNGNYRDFTKAFEKELFDNLLGTEFKKSMHEIRDKLAKDLGVEIGELPKTLGELAGKQLSEFIKKSGLGKLIFDPIAKYRENLANEIKTAYNRGYNELVSDLGGSVYNRGQRTGSAQMSDIFDTAEQAEPIRQFNEETLRGAGALNGMNEVVRTVGPKILKTTAATVGLALAVDLVVSGIKKELKPAFDSFKKTIELSETAMKRDQKTRENNLKLSLDRFKNDIETYVSTPFKILEEAAQRWYDTWDSTLRSISATQGYTKEQVQQLYGNFVDRLKTEGLTEVVGANDIVNNLANVLSTGLQGAAAEEFAYIATKLNAAIPTQDFFQYAQTYQLVASNAISQGKSLEEALALADAELESFANSVLYAGRELSSGFATGLKSAENLFQKAEQIAQAGRYESGAQLGASLTSIAAITGAVAPDLSSAIVDAIYNASVGGNASELVALRSLAGINASNTEFLNSLLQNPQQVLGDLFDKLNQYQNMASGAYMEVAEGLSSIFGVSTEALARVDFGQVANAVRASANPSNALDQNMKLLVSGQTTTTAEMQRIYEANKYMMDEGLAYVLDNEVTREIQKHMWSEQIAQELMETTYGVELTGSAADTLVKLENAVTNIKAFLGNQKVWFDRAENLTVTTVQDDAIKADIANLLNLTKIGSGNAFAYRWLTTYGENLGVASNYLEMLNSTSSYRATQNLIGDSVALRASNTALYDYNATVADATSNLLAATNSISALGGFQAIENIIDLFKGDFGYISKQTDELKELESYNLDLAETAQSYSDIVINALTSTSDAFSSTSDVIESTSKSTVNALLSPASAYSWNMVGKSALGRLGGGIYDYNTGETIVAANALSTATQNQSVLLTNFQKMIDSMDEFYAEDNNRTYEDFVATAKQYGIADFEAALEKSGISQVALENKFDDLQTQTAITQKAQRESNEEKFWEDSILELTTSHSLLDQINTTATNIYNIFDGFISAWKDYFIEHTVYNNAYTRDAVQKVLNEERDSSETAIYALADALTQNDISLLKDPTLQTNALLAQILKVANAILNQQGTGTGGLSLPDTLAGLSLGIIET